MKNKVAGLTVKIVNRSNERLPWLVMTSHDGEHFREFCMADNERDAYVCYNDLLAEALKRQHLEAVAKMIQYKKQFLA